MLAAAGSETRRAGIAEERGREAADVGEAVQVPQADRQGLASAHRQPRDRPVLAVGPHGIVRFDVGDDVLQQVVLKAADEVAEPAPAATRTVGGRHETIEALGELLLVQFAGVELLVEGLGGGEEFLPRHHAVLVGIGSLHDGPREDRARPRPLGRAVGHDHDHGDDLLVGEEIVEDDVGRTVPGPAPFVVAGAVQQIEDRVLRVLRVAGRQVDHHLACVADGFRVVLHGLDLAALDTVAPAGEAARCRFKFRVRLPPGECHRSQDKNGAPDHEVAQESSHRDHPHNKGDDGHQIPKRDAQFAGDGLAPLRRVRHAPCASEPNGSVLEGTLRACPRRKDRL